ncbi:hypothetical protein [Streptomyces panaciradicis]|uniref:hypothetical protein n=1 Tax=Streptomyces panaciradicis TaxID=1470261 RepID=UPI00201CE4C1|nr:hypothetical protein [Streptomyces panaciradicis]MCL6670899.1 hypothetical protein [Streptomyces panaciradicis]
MVHNQWFNGWTGYSNETPFQLGHTGYVYDHPLANLFGVDTGSTSYVAGQWTGVVGTFAIDGYGAYKAVSGGIKAVKLAMSEGEDFVGAVKRLLSGDLPTTTPADPAPTTPKSGDAPSTPKAGTGKGGKEPGGSGKSGARSGDEPSAGSESKQATPTAASATRSRTSTRRDWW